ncbi:DUF1794 domain-containing protein [Psychromonas sp. RZ22]|uniref:heme-binding beta-barrel domain-containing protein n=1 Tax=Psychromonas algarum TaxID=2555643 RepID=UPI0010677AFF|nr:heme-binding beta-barrel domain-containing protein [Psychromonas sp. RZ22]TEW55269.1 DUF1794 domain-containing protein [Psychromonas sp. RZ22]
MQDNNLIDYGPLTGLIGTWTGNKGKDLAPEPDGTEYNDYYETIIFTEAHDVANAEEENISALHYIQKVQRITNDKVIHQETGYWMWEQGTDNVIHSMTIPRGICVLAGGKASQSVDTVLDVVADVDSQDWPIAQTAFLQKKAKMKTYTQQMIISGDTLSYKQNMLLDIYGRTFDHSDENTLTKVS